MKMERIRDALWKFCSCFGLILSLFSPHVYATITATILAGGETDLPADTPSGRLDTEGMFSFVGALAIFSGSSTCKGSAVALSRDWVLTAGHNADLNDDGLPDSTWSGAFHLPGYHRHPGTLQRGFAAALLAADAAA